MTTASSARDWNHSSNKHSPGGTEPTCTRRRAGYVGRARLLERVFETDQAHCPNCGGNRRLSDAEMIRSGGSFGSAVPDRRQREQSLAR